MKKYRQIKEGLAAQVKEMAHGMVLVRVPHPKAWQIELDWQDVSSASELRAENMKRSASLTYRQRITTTIPFAGCPIFSMRGGIHVEHPSLLVSLD